MNATQAPASKPLNTIQAVNLALDEAMRTDPDVILLGEDIADEQAGGIVGVTKGLSQKYGRSRVRSTPISEQAIIGAAIGAANAFMAESGLGKELLLQTGTKLEIVLTRPLYLSGS